MPQPDIENKKYEKLLKERRIWYKNLKPINCPILKENVTFTSKGFHHLIYPGGIARPIKERMYKLGLLPLVVPVIKKAASVHKKNRLTDKKTGKQVELITLRETVGLQSTEVTVVLRKIGTGNLTFLSVSKKKDRGIRSKLTNILKIKRTPHGKR